MTTAHATAWYGLHDLARIRGGDKVLIHSATGGVGQAAIAIARRSGPRSSPPRAVPQRRQIVARHGYRARLRFAQPRVRRSDPQGHRGYGVDIVLNSSAGAAQRAGLELLSFGGRFVEIGKRDIYGDTRLGLFPFRRNLIVLRRRPGVDGTTHPDRLRDAADHGLPTDRRRRAADAGEHALPARRCRPPPSV